MAKSTAKKANAKPKSTAKKSFKPVDRAGKPLEKKEDPVKVVEKSEPAVKIIEPEGKWILTGAELLPLVQGFESEVAQLKHLEIKVANKGKNGPVLLRQLDAQKRIVNNYLSKLNVEV